jgi:hypothetical protein
MRQELEPFSTPDILGFPTKLDDDKRAKQLHRNSEFA